MKDPINGNQMGHYHICNGRIKNYPSLVCSSCGKDRGGNFSTTPEEVAKIAKILENPVSNIVEGIKPKGNWLQRNLVFKLDFVKGRFELGAIWIAYFAIRLLCMIINAFL